MSGEISFSVKENGKASITVMPTGDKKGAFWLNGLVLRGK